jgi:hypothetical protein
MTRQIDRVCMAQSVGAKERVAVSIRRFFARRHRAPTTLCNRRRAGCALGIEPEGLATPDVLGAAGNRDGALHVILDPCSTRHADGAWAGVVFPRR